MPGSPENRELIEELFSNGVDKTTVINPPVFTLLGNTVKLGKNIVLMNGFKCMSAGGLTIEDNTLVAINCTILTNNHDFYDRPILTCKPVHIKKNVWIGANVVIMQGICIGDGAIIGANAVVTKSIEEGKITIAGIPAKVLAQRSIDLRYTLGGTYLHFL